MKRLLAKKQNVVAALVTLRRLSDVMLLLLHCFTVFSRHLSFRLLVMRNKATGNHSIQLVWTEIVCCFQQEVSQRYRTHSYRDIDDLSQDSHFFLNTLCKTRQRAFSSGHFCFDARFITLAVFWGFCSKLSVSVFVVGRRDIVPSCAAAYSLSIGLACFRHYVPVKILTLVLSYPFFL